MRCLYRVRPYELVPGASEVNQLNRIKLMLGTAKKNAEQNTPSGENISKKTPVGNGR